MEYREPPKPSRIDRAIETFAPTWAARRYAARIAIWRDEIELSYRGGVTSRTDSPHASTIGRQGVNHPLNQTTLTELRDRARDLDENNALASSSLDRAVENVIGTGPVLQMRSTDSAFNEAVEKRWEKWKDEADIRELCDLGELWRLDYRSELRDGDVGMVLVDRGGMPRLQYVEGDLIENNGYKDGWIDGILWNRVGAPRAFQVAVVDNWGTRKYPDPIPASNFIFSMRMNRTSQFRGAPVFAQTFWLFDHVDGYVEGVVTSSRAGACQALFVTKQNAGNTYASLAQNATDSAGKTRRSIQIEPLQIHYLNPGEMVQGFNPTQPGQQFTPAIRTFCQLMGLNLGLAVEQVLLDFSQVTYLSSRAMRQQADATANVAKDRFERKKLRRVLPWWIDRMAAMGEIPSGPEDRYAHEWIYAPRGWIDPDKDLKAALIELDMGLTTMEILAKERGREFAELVAKRSAEIKAMKTADIPVVMSSQTREMGAVAGAPPTDETPQEEMPQEEETPQEDTEE